MLVVYLAFSMADKMASSVAGLTDAKKVELLAAKWVGWMVGSSVSSMVER